MSYFRDLDLVEFSAVDDKGRYIVNAELDQFEAASYSCGLFHFTRTERYRPQ